MTNDKVTEVEKNNVSIKWYKRVLHDMHNFLLRSAHNSLDGKYDERKLQDAGAMVRRYEKWLNHSAFYSSIFFSILSFAKINDSTHVILKVLHFLCVVLVVVSILAYIISSVQKSIWEEVENSLKDNNVKRLSEQIKEYKVRVEELEREKELLIEINSILSELQTQRQLGKKTIEIEEYLVGLTLDKLNKDKSGKYSVAIYHCVNNNVIMGGYSSNIIGETGPTIYRKVISNKKGKYREYYSVKCVGNQEENVYVLLTRQEIKKKLIHPSERINQYASRSFGCKGAHRILLEVIAYDDTVFSGDAETNKYIESLLFSYGLLFVTFSSEIAIGQYA